MPTYKGRKMRNSDYDKDESDRVLKKYAKHIPRHYTEEIQYDLAKRREKDVTFNSEYTDAQIRDFFQRRNFHRDICISVENVGKQYFEEKASDSSTSNMKEAEKVAFFNIPSKK